MAAKTKTSISIRTAVFRPAKELADSEDRDFSFVVERALVGELHAAGVAVGGETGDPRAEILATAEELGVGAAAQILTRAVRRKRRRAAG
jgi:hypothetical protein